MAINKLIKNSDIAAVASSLADATGLSDVTAGYINFIALSQMEGRTKSKYTELCNSIEKGTHSADDLSKCKELYSAMKEVEIRIQEAYRDMNSDNPEIQIECNEKIAELERMEIRKKPVQLTGSNGYLKYEGN